MDRDRVLVPKQQPGASGRDQASSSHRPSAEPGCVVADSSVPVPINRLLWDLRAASSAGETIEAAARRECHEEIGQVQDVGSVSMFPTPGYSDEEMFFFRASSLRCRRKAPNSTRMKSRRSPHVCAQQDIRQMVRRGEIIDMKSMDWAVAPGILKRCAGSRLPRSEPRGLSATLYFSAVLSAFLISARAWPPAPVLGGGYSSFGRLGPSFDVVDDRLQVRRQRRVKIHPRPWPGVTCRKTPLRAAARRANPRSAGGRRVQRVADDRMADGVQVDADLVRAAGRRATSG